ncbi:twin-arginine translocation signal domain-containing protein [Aeromonas hydrophila]|nr:twin-arginine translocation signal domain-containing protein [Aeromonas hydrophila]
MDHSKRKFLKGAAIAGGTGLFVAGYSDTLKQVATRQLGQADPGSHPWQLAGRGVPG